MEEPVTFQSLPVVSEAVKRKIVASMEEYGRLGLNTQLQYLHKGLKELEARNPELAAVIRGVTSGALDYEPVTWKLTHSEWDILEILLLYSHVLVLQALNEARAEGEG